MSWGSRESKWQQNVFLVSCFCCYRKRNSACFNNASFKVAVIFDSTPIPTSAEVNCDGLRHMQDSTRTFRLKSSTGVQYKAACPARFAPPVLASAILDRHVVFLLVFLPTRAAGTGGGESIVGRPASSVFRTASRAHGGAPRRRAVRNDV